MTMLNFFKTNLSSADAAQFLIKLAYEVIQKRQGDFDELICVYKENISVQTKLRCDWELFYIVNTLVYLMASINFKYTKNPEIMGQYLSICNNILHYERTQKDGDYAFSQFELRIQAYRLAWINKDMNVLTGVRSVLQSTVSEILKTGDLNMADDFIIEFINDPNIINNERFQLVHKLPSLIAGPMCLTIITSIDEALNSFSNQVKIR